MKTLTLTDEAYERLKSWKDSSRESFSSVVMRLVPKRGTAEDLNRSFGELPPLTDAQKQILGDRVPRIPSS